MSTHCIVALALNDNTYATAYINSDGYPEHMMPMLNKHFSEYVEAARLCSRNDMRGIYEPNPAHDTTRVDIQGCMQVFKDGGPAEKVTELPTNGYVYVYSDGAWEEYDTLVA